MWDFAFLQYLLTEQSNWWPVWPDLAKFRHFANILKDFGNFWRALLILGKILNLLWQNDVCYWVNGQNWKHNRAIWSHCYMVTKFFCLFSDSFSLAASTRSSVRKICSRSVLKCSTSWSNVRNSATFGSRSGSVRTFENTIRMWPTLTRSSISFSFRLECNTKLGRI